MRCRAAPPRASPGRSAPSARRDGKAAAPLHAPRDRGGASGARVDFAATITAVPTLRGRARRIVEAQRCRGLSPRGSLGNRLRALRALALPLVLSALHDVDERALALETRGMVSGARRTPLAPPPDPAVERAARWALL